jgi:hypothetical protein
MQRPDVELRLCLSNTLDTEYENFRWICGYRGGDYEEAILWDVTSYS